MRSKLFVVLGPNAQSECSTQVPEDGDWTGEDLDNYSYFEEISEEGLNSEDEGLVDPTLQEPEEAELRGIGWPRVRCRLPRLCI